MQVFQAGYTIEERVLRPAMVAVSKGGQKAAAPQPAPEAPPAS
ncbi:nucleotide exchange factor GrpE [Salmonella enterica]